MKSLKNIALGAVVMGSACASASAWDTILAQINDPGLNHDVPQLSQFVSPSDYIGMAVRAYDCSGGFDTITLAPGNIPGYPAGTATPETHLACGVGLGWSVHVFNSATGRLGFCFRGVGPVEICAFEILALDSIPMVFDRSDPGPGTTGSGWGGDASIVNYGYGSSGWPGNSDYNMYYIDQVGVMGMPAVGDTYGRMYIELVGSPHDINDVISFTVDMDLVGNRPGDPDPGPNDSGVPGDINGDSLVDGIDLAELLGLWNTGEEAADLNDDGIVNGEDLAIVLGNWQ